MSSPLRPTSPHLGIYRPQISSVLSITHRATGVALYAGAALMALWLWSAAYAPDYYGKLHECLVSPVGKLFMLGWTFAFFFHLGSGIRHLFWDMGKGFSLPVMHKTGWLVVVFSVAMTIAAWMAAYSMAGQNL